MLENASKTKPYAFRDGIYTEPVMLDNDNSLVLIALSLVFNVCWGSAGKKKKINKRKRMIWTQSQAMIFATVSRVCFEIEAVCSLSNSSDRITEHVQNFHSLCSHLASEQVDGVWQKVPNDGYSGATPAQRSLLCSATCRWSESVHGITLVLHSRCPGLPAGGHAAHRPGHWRGMLEERGPVSQQPQEGGSLRPKPPREVICALGSSSPQTPGWKAGEVIWFLVQHRYKHRNPRPEMKIIID